MLFKAYNILKFKNTSRFQQFKFLPSDRRLVHQELLASPLRLLINDYSKFLLHVPEFQGPICKYCFFSVISSFSRYCLTLLKLSWHVYHGDQILHTIYQFLFKFIPSTIFFISVKPSIVKWSLFFILYCIFSAKGEKINKI